MKNLSLIFILMLSGCLNASPNSQKIIDPVCNFDFHFSDICEYRQITVKFSTFIIAPDETLLKGLEVTFDSKNIELQVLEDTTLLSGDKGYVSFEDINFDGLPDIAITTSFGTANLYLDYWIYVEKEKTFKSVGNYSRFIVDEKSKTLQNIVKMNAAEYQTNVYRWENNELIKN